MSILGRGLESLIPKKDKEPEEQPALDVLYHQTRISEPVYRFHDEVTAILAEAPPDEPVAVTASAPVTSSAPPSPDLSAGQAGLRRAMGSVFWIEVSKIEPNPYQPRRDFNVEELASLADSIREHGLLQPLLVTKRAIDTPSGMDVRYQLIAGERRWRAAKLAGLRDVPVMIRPAGTPEREKLELALIENVQREDLNPMERARAFEQLVNEFGLMQKEVAERIGKSREVVANALRLLKLPIEIQTAIASSAITEGHARAILMLDGNPEAQKNVFRQITAAHLTVRDAELAARASGASPLQRRRRGGGARLDPDSRALQRQLEEIFGTKVKLSKRGEHGRIVVEFYSDEELRGILDRISKREEGYV